MPRRDLLRATELERADLAGFRERIAGFELEAAPHEPRAYPGYPRVELPRGRPRLFPSLDRVLAARRSGRELSSAAPARAALGRLLGLSHGVNAARGRGPAPSAGGLQAVELFVVALEPASWLAAGAYHYDRAGHHLSRVAEGAARAAWERRVPSMAQFVGGALLLVLVGDRARVEPKYGERAARLLLLEAGHVMQNVLLVATSLGLGALPLGGFVEREIAAALSLPAGDAVLYVAACGGK